MGVVESVRAVRWDPAQGTPVHCANAQAMGATAVVVVVMNVSGADPIGTIRLYGEHVLPRLRS